MPDTSKTDLAEVSRTVRFVKFLREAVAIKTKKVLEVQKYPTVMWFSDLPANVQEVRSPLTTAQWSEADPHWLRVVRVQESERPAPPEPCLPWLKGVDLESPATAPAINDAYEDVDADGNPVQEPLIREARAAWETYVATKWTEWAHRVAVVRQVRPVYQKLFNMHQSLVGAPDAFDLFVGVGLFHAKLDADRRFRRHLIAFPAELSVDDRTGTLSLRPSADFVGGRFETDFVPAADKARLQPLVDALASDLAAVGAGIADRTALDELLTRVVTPLNAMTSYVPSLAPADAPADGAVVSFGAALILRPRSMRSLEALLDKVEKDTSGQQPRFRLADLPVPWRKMVDDGETWASVAEDRSRRATGTGRNGRVYFPLPSNDEQSRIVQKTEGSPGVVVQGPPGTGKSHTIANLISHYLAMGRRVLVTAQSAQALQVLREKMPEELQQLCVTLLGDSRVSDRTLKRSVEGIIARQQDFRPGDYRNRIDALERQLDESETHLMKLERTLRDSRAKETEVQEPIDGYRGTRAELARRLSAERSLFAWLGDAVNHSTACPTYADGWEALAAYHASLDPENRAALERVLLTPPFTEEESVGTLKSVIAAKTRLESLPPQHETAAPPQSAPESDLSTASAWLQKLADLDGTAATEDAVWVADVRKSLLRPSGVWGGQRDECTTSLARLTDDVVAATVKVEVFGRSVAAARRDLAKLHRHYTEGGSRRTFFGARPAVVKETDWVEQAVSLEGAAIQSAEEVSRARQAFEGWALLDAAWNTWEKWFPMRQGAARTQVTLLRARAKLLAILLERGAGGSELSADMRAWLDAGLGAGVSSQSLAAALNRRLAEIALAAERSKRDALASNLRRAIGGRVVVPSLNALLEALHREDADTVATAWADLRSEQLRREGHERYVDFLKMVRSGAPLVAGDIVAAEGTPVLRQAFIAFHQAWAHRRVQDWLDTVLSANRVEATHRAARDIRVRQQEHLAELTAERAWCEALCRINDLQRANLVSWARAVAAIPNTGKGVFPRRAAAQELLGRCLPSIPAWVVSLNRLYETVNPVPGLFDVAIVDESSQCWLDSLVLFYLAKQVIIVGDDKQISPTVVGVADTELSDLANTFLPDFQFRANFTLTSSLFDHGKTYLSDGVPLQEHFRCVPEIIGFSNTLCYSGKLIPLRQVAKNRLEPLKRTYLEHGLRRGDINDVEAHAIVETIAACHVDAAYEDADFGVICLQGDQQGERIEHLLLERLGPDVFARRRLRCGNPYAFQGDERDVMFLSMVVATNQAHQTLTAAMYEQRFNVAMSRARDQAWLFHSVREEDLGSNCLRRRVLDYFKNPPDSSIGGSSLDQPLLRLIAGRADRKAEKPPTPFDSWFEVDVALALASLGYTLTVQVRVAHKRIDLVVEGDEGMRLAVECDGDAWHGPEQYEADLLRQRQLERAGWRFLRVRECLFYADEAQAIQDVVAACAELEILPGGGRGRSRIESTPVPVAATPEPLVLADPDEEVATDDEAQPAPSAVRLRVTSTLPDNREQPELGWEDEATIGTGPSSRDREYPDPRTAPVRNVRSAVIDIVQRHGPLTKASLYAHYRKGCPQVERTGKQLRQALNNALVMLERMKRVEARDEGRRRLASEVVYRLPEQRWVDPRPSLGRDLDDVPLSELASEIARDGGGAVKNDAATLEGVLKGVARRYGALRFREQARERLTAAAELAFDEERRAALSAF